jgi:hypothetical protein
MVFDTSTYQPIVEVQWQFANWMTGCSIEDNLKLYFGTNNKVGVLSASGNQVVIESKTLICNICTTKNLIFVLTHNAEVVVYETVNYQYVTSVPVSQGTSAMCVVYDKGWLVTTDEIEVCIYRIL